jgi:hypothetical protein
LVEFIETCRDPIGARRDTLHCSVGIDQLARLPPLVGRLRLCFPRCPCAQPHRRRRRGVANRHQTVTPLKE